MTEERDVGMTTEEAIAMLEAGEVTEWNEYRRAHPGWRPDLGGEDLSNAGLGAADLRGANLSGANLVDANLGGTNLGDANVGDADLVYANLSGANLVGANLSGANLSGANLSQAKLSGANLSRAKLTGADLGQAKLSGANLGDALLGFTSFDSNDLSETKGLDTVRHYGPSPIDIHTLLVSKGKISKNFLLECGMPDTWIEYLPDLIASIDPIQFHSCFVSHSSKDQEFADKLYGALTDRGIRVWYAPEDLRGGKKLGDQVVGAIQAFDKLMLVLTENSVDAPWVQREIRWAVDKEKRENRPALFPIRLVPFERLEQWRLQPETSVDFDQVLNYFIPDFRGWEDDAVFNREIDKLIDALKADEKQKPEKSK